MKKQCYLATNTLPLVHSVHLKYSAFQKQFILPAAAILP